VFSARCVPMVGHTTMEYFMPPLSSICTATIEFSNNVKRCFLLGPCREILSRTVSKELVSQSMEWSLLVCELVESCCNCGRGQFGNPEEGERPPLEAVTRRLVKIQ
jgi:hypothetical protein